MVVFRSVTELAAFLIMERDSESFETLSSMWTPLLPILGALAIGIALTRLSTDDRRTGVVHVMERLSRHQGHLPMKNALVQFFGGAIALASGLSGGREGPAIHLGAASSSLLGQALQLPNNSVRMLVACGTAAAIAGSFNTPMAGVIFAMEVVMMEYTITSFIPVILSAVTATVISRYVFGDAVSFAVPNLEMSSLMDLPYVIFAGLTIGALAAGFIVAVRFFSKLDHWPFWLRAVVAGTITAGAALATPAVMGVGYDTVNQALAGQLVWSALLIILAAKAIASAACVGMGMPVGVIGPTLVIGAACGGALGYAGSVLSPETASSQGFYVMLGMTAMMAATLQAPLAALMTVLELTANPNIILPAMLIIVVATMTARQVFRQRSVFLTTLLAQGLEYPPDPASQHLLRAAVASIMERQFVRLADVVQADVATEALAQRPFWIVIEDADGSVRCLLNAVDLSNHLESSTDTEIDLMALPGERKDTGRIDVRATLHEAYGQLEHSGVEALCVCRTVAPMITPIVGILTREDIDAYARHGAH